MPDPPFTKKKMSLFFLRTKRIRHFFILLVLIIIRGLRFKNYELLI